MAGVSASHSAIARETGCSTDSIAASLRELERSGHVERRLRQGARTASGRTNLYVLVDNPKTASDGHNFEPKPRKKCGDDGQPQVSVPADFPALSPPVPADFPARKPTTTENQQTEALRVVPDVVAHESVWPPAYQPIAEALAEHAAAIRKARPPRGRRSGSRPASSRPHKGVSEQFSITASRISERCSRGRSERASPRGLTKTVACQFDLLAGAYSAMDRRANRSAPGDHSDNWAASGGHPNNATATSGRQKPSRVCSPLRGAARSNPAMGSGAGLAPTASRTDPVRQLVSPIRASSKNTRCTRWCPCLTKQPAISSQWSTRPLLVRASLELEEPPKSSGGSGHRNKTLDRLLPERRGFPSPASPVRTARMDVARGLSETARFTARSHFAESSGKDIENARPAHEFLAYSNRKSEQNSGAGVITGYFGFGRDVVSARSTSHRRHAVTLRRR